MHGVHEHPSGVEDPAGLLDHLFCLGIHVPCHPRGRPRSAAPASRGAAIPCGRHRSLWLDNDARRASAESPPMDLSFPARATDLRIRLRIVVLGRAACAFRPGRGHDGYHPGLHGAFRNYLPAHAKANPSPYSCAPDRNCRSGRAGQPFAEFEWSADRQNWSDRPHRRSNQLVDRFRAHPQAAAAILQSGQFGRPDARWRGAPHSNLRIARRVSRLSSVGRLTRSMALVALPDCGRLHRRIHRLRLAHSS